MARNSSWREEWEAIDSLDVDEMLMFDMQEPELTKFLGAFRQQQYHKRFGADKNIRYMAEGTKVCVVRFA